MKIQELVILGLLNQSPEHGYKIKKFLKQVLAMYTDIETESIYYPLKLLAEQGYVEKRIGRQGHRPEKYIYSITEKGKDYFQKLLRKNMLVLKRPFINIDLSLYFLPQLDKKVAKRELKVRARGLGRIKRWLLQSMQKQKNRDKHLNYILQHNLELLEAEERFTHKLLNLF